MDPTGALFLLGVTQHRAGDQDAALELLRKVAAAPDATALHLLGYADVSLNAGHPEAALDAARKAIGLDATMPLAWLCLGNVLCRMQRYLESRDSLERALQLDPHLGEARESLAIVLGRMGEIPAAIDHFQRLLTQAPDNAVFRGNFVVLLQDCGRYEDALVEAEQAVALHPWSLDTHLRAATIEMQIGRYWPALERLTVAEDILSERTPEEEARLWTLKAHLLRHVDHFDAAVALCRDALGKGIESVELMRAYGLALQSAGADAEALEIFDGAVEAATNPATLLSDKGVLLTQLGQLAAAGDAFDRALAHEPTLAEVWYNKTNAKTYVADDPGIVAMERLLGGSSRYSDRVLLHFALGKAYMDVGEVDAAFRQWHAGNRMKRATVDYDADAAASRMASIAARPTDFGAEPADPTDPRSSELPVFIVGMPRSGSSLVEQILASHPEVYGAGEGARLRALFERADLEAGEPVPCGEDGRIAATVLDRLRRLSAHASRILDKDLANFLHLGTIHRVLPRARIIHCRRDSLDTCFSAYTKLFLGDLNFSYDLTELGRYFVAYHSLMEHWRSVLPPQVFLEIDYETLVSDPQTQTHRLVDFLGIPWNDACLRFFESRRKVSTASVTQVRLPIYRSSLGRARSLGRHLQPLIQVLGDLAPADIQKEA